MPSKTFSRGDRTRFVIDVATTVIATSIIFWNFFIGPIIENTIGESPLVRLLAIAYPAGDLLLLWVDPRIRFEGGSK